MMDDLLAIFLVEGRELVAEAQANLATLARDAAAAPAIDAAFRAVHTLKGSVGVFDMAAAGRVLHAGEDLLERARAGDGALAPAALAALVDCIDQVDRWIDAMEADGRLPAGAGDVAARLTARLAGGSVAGAAPSVRSEAAPAWLDALLDSAAALPEAREAATAFRYTPDPGCFFRGDDPLKIAAAVPGLVALRVVPAAAWPSLEEMAPFDCRLMVEGLSTADSEAVRAAFMAVRDQLGVAAVPRRAAPAEAKARSLRIDEARIDALADQVGELLLVGNALAQLTGEVARQDAALGARIRQVQAGLERGIATLHRTVTAVRMVPLAATLRRLPRLAREIAVELDRDVAFIVEGEATEADKAVADMLFEPLLHLLRNAIDHGVEPPEVRRAAGKPEQATVRLTAARQGERLGVTLADDGAGIDPARIRAVAVARRLLPAAEAEAMTDEAALQLVFTPGFSTATRATDISGRGVGMDAVKAAVEALGGSVALESRPGAGTTARMLLPLSAITTRLLLVAVREERYGVPFHAIAETAIVPAAAIAAVGRGRAVVLRGRTVPVLSLAALLGLEERAGEAVRLLVVEAGGERVALTVEAFGVQIEAMVRPPSRLLAGLPAIAGTALLGDGQLVLVLDPERLVA